MKRFSFIVSFLTLVVAIFPSLTYGQVIDDIYLTPNDEVMLKKADVKKHKDNNDRPVYKNGAREIVFIDQNGNQTTLVTDTVYVVNEQIDSLATDSLDEEGYYLNGFKGSESDLEYAERIRRFHNPRYAIHIGDPRYNDIYFMDSYDWNVYVDGSYAYVTPTWTNPYWWNYSISPYSSWGFGYSPYYSWGSYYNPWYSSYWGWDSGYYGGYYGWGYPYSYGSYYGWGYPYDYGGYYGWNYPYYGGWYHGGNSSYSDQTARSNRSYGSRSVNNSSVNAGGRTSILSGGRSVNSSNAYTTVSRSRTGRDLDNVTNTSGRSVNTINNTRAVRSSEDWNNTRGSSTYSTRTSSTNNYSGTVNRSNPSSNSSTSRGSSNSYSTPSRSSSTSGGSRSSNSYSTPSSSYDSGSRSSSSSSSSSRSSSSSSSSGSSTSSGSSSSSRSSSSSGGGGRR